MPSADQHRKKAERNRQFLDTLPIDDYPEWLVVVIFYVAVHLVERLRAAIHSGHSTGHDERLMYVQGEHPSIHTAYHILQNVSMLARYQSMSDFFKQVQSAMITERLIGKYLVEIERYVDSRLGTGARSP